MTLPSWGQTSTISCCPSLRVGSVGSKEANCSKNLSLGHYPKMAMRTCGVCWLRFIALERTVLTLDDAGFLRTRSAPTSPSDHCGSCFGHLPHVDSLPGNWEAGLLCYVGGSLSSIWWRHQLPKGVSLHWAWSVDAVVSEIGGQVSEKFSEAGFGPEVSPWLQTGFARSAQKNDNRYCYFGTQARNLASLVPPL